MKTLVEVWAQGCGQMRRRQRPRSWTMISLVLVVVATGCSNSTLPPGAGGGSSQAEQVGGAPTTDPTDAQATSQGPGSAGRVGAGTTGSRGTQQQSGVTTGGSRVGVTNDTIRISVSGAFSGSLSPIVNKSYDNAIAVWQKEVNASNGIHGRKIALVKVDNQFTPEGAIAACKETQSNGTFMVLNMGSAPTEVDCEDAASIPQFVLNPSYVKPWKYAIALFYLPAISPTVVSFLKSSYMNAGPNKIGIVYNESPGAVEEYKHMVEELQKQGLQFVHAEKTSNSQSSFVSEMSRMQASGAQTVMLLTSLEGPGIIRDSRAIGYNPQWYGGGSGGSSDIGSKAGNELFQGVRGLRYVTTTETPAYAGYVEKVRKYQGDANAGSADTVDATYYGQADILGEILRLAGQSLTRESFVAAGRGTDNYDNHLLAPFGLKGRSLPVGEWAAFPVECCKSDYTYKLLGGPRERF